MTTTRPTTASTGYLEVAPCVGGHVATRHRGGEVVDDERAHLAAGFGSRLRSHRKANGLTQEALARRAGVTTSTVSRYERGTQRPGRAAVHSLAAVLAPRIPLDLAHDLQAAAGDSWREGRAWAQGAPPRRMGVTGARQALRRAEGDLVSARSLYRKLPAPGVERIVTAAKQRLFIAQDDVQRAEALANLTTP